MFCVHVANGTVLQLFSASREPGAMTRGENGITGWKWPAVFPVVVARFYEHHDHAGAPRNRLRMNVFYVSVPIYNATELAPTLLVSRYMKLLPQNANAH